MIFQAAAYQDLFWYTVQCILFSFFFLGLEEAEEVIAVENYRQRLNFIGNP